MNKFVLLLSLLFAYQILGAQKLKEHITYYDDGKINAKGYVYFSDTFPPSAAGYWVLYYPNGKKIMEGEMKYGKQIGPWKVYYENGQKRLDAFFEHKKVTEPNLIYARDKSGQIIEENGKSKIIPESYNYESFCAKEWISYWDDGKPACKYTIKNGCYDYSQTTKNDLLNIEILNTRKIEKYNYKNGSYGKGEMVLDDLLLRESNHLESVCVYGRNGIITDLDDLLKTNGSFKRFGVWEEYDSSGILKNKSPYDWQTNKIEGIVKFYYTSGKIKSEQTYVEGKKYGPVVDYFESNGKIKAMGNLTDNTYNGTWLYYYENGTKKSEISYKDGKKYGRSVFYYPNGKIKSRGFYIEDKMAENWVRYYENGNIKTDENYDYNEALDGIVRYYHPNEKILAIEEWSKGELLEPIICYDSLGNKILSDGEGTMLKYHDNGVLKQYIEYKRYCRDGITRFYYDNGQLEESILYKYDSKNSPIGLRMEILSSFHRDGKVREKGTLKDGNGTWIQYNEKGEVENVKHFTNGIEIKQ